MCGRFAAFSSADAIADQLAIQVISAGARLLPPSWNVAPTNEIAVIIKPDADEGTVGGGCGLELTTARWGLSGGQRNWQVGRGSGIINARAESIAHKRTFADAFVHRRCLVPIDGYYEWQTLDNQTAEKSKRKQPWYFTNPDGGLLLFTGIFNVTDAGLNVAITTMPANRIMAPIHHRMPTVLDPAQIDIWFKADVETAENLIVHAPQHVTKIKVNPWVNNVRNNGPQLITPMVGGAPEVPLGSTAVPELTLF